MNHSLYLVILCVILSACSNKKEPTQSLDHQSLENNQVANIPNAESDVQEVTIFDLEPTIFYCVNGRLRFLGEYLVKGFAMNDQLLKNTGQRETILIYTQGVLAKFVIVQCSLPSLLREINSGV